MSEFLFGFLICLVIVVVTNYLRRSGQ